MKQAMIDNFLKYVAINTKSDPSSDTCPSTKEQFDLAHVLVDDLKALGLEVQMDENGYVYGRLPGNCDKDVKTVCFLAHMDTAPDLSGENVRPQIIENYDGSVIKLNEQYNLDPKVFSSLNDYHGKTLITTSGDTLLGADDKAGIAEIMQALTYIKNDPDFIHGDIAICFTPDEEIGRGVDKINLDLVNADFAYTIDGGKPGVFAIENFNAASAKIVINGLNVHPGEAYNKMVNAQSIARELDMTLGDECRPESTQGHEGFYLLTSINGTVEKCVMTYIIRDHDTDKFEALKAELTSMIKDLEAKYPNAKFELEITDSYYNMLSKVNEHPYIVEYAKTAYLNQGHELVLEPIRGGTDGSRLSFMGLPCPNIYTGGYNYHGRYEFICVESMLEVSNIIKDIIKEVAKDA